jgi:hypothetical protein
VLTELSREQYLATFAPPMRSVKEGESFKPIEIGAYVHECIRGFDEVIRPDDLQVQDVYLNGNESYCHVLLNYGRRNEYLVIVIDCAREAVHGHYCLDLNAEYGLNPIDGQ